MASAEGVRRQLQDAAVALDKIEDRQDDLWPRQRVRALIDAEKCMAEAEKGMDSLAKEKERYTHGFPLFLPCKANEYYQVGGNEILILYLVVPESVVNPLDTSDWRES